MDLVRLGARRLQTERASVKNKRANRLEKLQAFAMAKLTAEIEDAELQAIVQQAAQELGAPIAIAVLFLEHIVFFSAECGLPPNSPRTLPLDLSFCRFIAQDGELFEVQDAEADTRIPPEMYEGRDVKAYLGIPVRMEGSVVGSLCVTDTQKRIFTGSEKECLEALALKVGGRLQALSSQRTDPLLQFAQAAGAPGVMELRRTLLPIHSSAQELRLINATLRSTIKLFESIREQGLPAVPEFEQGRGQLSLILPQLEDVATEIEAGLGDVQDMAEALESIMESGVLSRISSVVMAAQDLSRAMCAKVGGAPLPEFPIDPYIAAPQFIAVSLVSNGLTQLAVRMAELDLHGGIRITLEKRGRAAVVALCGNGLSATDYQRLAPAFRSQFESELAVGVEIMDDGIRLAFATTEEREPEPE